MSAKRAKRSAVAKSAAADSTGLAGELADSIASWIAVQPDKPLVFALEHHYTQRGLSLELLKGADRQIADLVVSAAEESNCCVHFTQVTRHRLQFADDGSFGRYGRSHRAPRGPLEIGETYEDDLNGTQWTDMSGKKQPLGAIAFDVPAIVSAVPIDDWKPTSEEYEGYTGNAGNTLDRWYHRSAIVVWPRDRHFDVVASTGGADSIPLFCSMVGKLARSPKKRLEKDRDDCRRFARAIIAHWPRRTARDRFFAGDEDTPYDAFPEFLLRLHDRDLIALFLATLADRDRSLRLDSFVVSACREYGWSVFADELKRLISARGDAQRRADNSFTGVVWLCAVCSDDSTDTDKSELVAELCRLAVDRFCEPRPPRPENFWYHDRRESSHFAHSLPLLLKALLSSSREKELSRVIDFVQASPGEFTLDDSQVPCLKLLIPWSKKRMGGVHPQLARWLAAVRQQLQSATAVQPPPPTNWARPAEVACNCRFCEQLNTFLADPAAEVTRIPAREDMRQHLTGAIARHRCDVAHSLERRGSPHSLVLKKTTGSHERAVKRFQLDRKLLDSLP